MEIRFLNGGYCRQLLGLIDRRSWRLVRFNAVFLAAYHIKEGWVLIDTGYGGRFADATRNWPYRLYRWATPATMVGWAGQTLLQAQINPLDIRHIIVTHFHADHIGGLNDFPNAQVHFHVEAWRLLAHMKPSRQLFNAYLPMLIPDWLSNRGHAIEQSEFELSSDLPFLLHDLFGDESIRLVYLPGHAPGHLGILLPTSSGPLLYAADAYWSISQIQDGIDLLKPFLYFQWDRLAYQQTICQLREIMRAGEYRIQACHTLEIQVLVNYTRENV